MSSVSFLTAKMQASRLDEAARSAEARGGAVHHVPSPFPEAPSPFDFAQGAALSSAGYRCAVEWLSDRAPQNARVDTSGAEHGQGASDEPARA